MLSGNVPSQSCLLQRRHSWLFPLQSRPPSVGRGLLHARRRCWMPPPQSNVHSDHTVHSPHTPSVGAGVGSETQQILNHHTIRSTAGTTLTFPQKRKEYLYGKIEPTKMGNDILSDMRQICLDFLEINSTKSKSGFLSQITII